LEPADLRDESFAVDLVYIANLSNKSADCYPALIERAKSRGALVATNPGVRQLSARGGVFFECLRSIDILALNRTEAGVLVPSLVAKYGESRGPGLPLAAGEDAPDLATRGLHGGGFDLDLADFLKRLTSLGPQHILLTDGSRGAFVATRDSILYCPAHKVPNVAGTAGAGDAFSSTFIGLLASGRSEEDAVRAATFNAASVVTHVDTQTGLLKSRDLEGLLSQAPPSLAVRHWKI
jgi:ribokinase